MTTKIERVDYTTPTHFNVQQMADRVAAKARRLRRKNEAQVKEGIKEGLYA